MDFMGDLWFSHSLHIICAVRLRIRTETIRPVPLLALHAYGHVRST